MSFKAWARANAPKVYKPPKQPPKSTEPVLSVEAAPTEFQPGDLIHFISTLNQQVYYGRYIRTEIMTTSGHPRIWGYWNSNRDYARNETRATHTEAANVRPGWPNRPTAPIIRQPIIEPVAQADEFDEWDEF